MQLRIAAIIAAFLAATALAGPVEKRASCTATSYDTISATKTCTSITIQGPFTVPANSKIDLTGLITGTKIKITGKITFAKGTLDKSNDLVTIGGSSITIDGTSGTFDGSGPAYWDGQGGNGGVNKPKFIRLKSLSGSITGLTIVGSPIHTFSISGCKGLTLSGITIDNRGANYSLGHNTDGFDVASSSSNVTITGAKVYNNDDCLAVNSGSNIYFKNNLCDGGHGISIGSIKASQIVDGVWVNNCTVSNSDNGVRIKAYADATGGAANNIHYTDITLSSIAKYGIIIQQDYTNDGATGVPGGAAPITNVYLNNIHGTMSGGKRVYILCANCTNFDFQSISITGGSAGSCTGISPKPTGCP